MPTPFSHLKQAQRLLVDAGLPQAMRELLQDQRPAFQLGSVIADARVTGGLGREVTHFYRLDQPITDCPWRLMFAQNPGLTPAKDEAHLAFLAGYVAHLALDEYWAMNMVRPHFWESDWDIEDWRDKLYALHLILTVMDERDEEELRDWQAESLGRCEPCEWLPFLSDGILREWRDFVAGQIAPGGESQTLAIFSRRLRCDEAEVRATLDDAERMQARLWRHIDPALLMDVEARAYVYTREQLAAYLREFAGY